MRVFRRTEHQTYTYYNNNELHALREKDWREKLMEGGIRVRYLWYSDGITERRARHKTSCTRGIVAVWFWPGRAREPRSHMCYLKTVAAHSRALQHTAAPAARRVPCIMCIYTYTDNTREAPTTLASKSCAGIRLLKFQLSRNCFHANLRLFLLVLSARVYIK